MKLRLSLWPPVLELETPDPEQVSTIDLVSAVIHTMQAGQEPIVLVREPEDEDEN